MKRFLLAGLAASALVLVAAMVIGGDFGGLLFGAVAIVFPVPLMALGALRRGRIGRAAWPLIALAVLLESGYWTMVILAGRVEQTPWVGGLPLATVCFLVSIWLLPLVLVSLAYAATFHEHGVHDEDLERLRSLSAARRDD